MSFMCHILIAGGDNRNFHLAKELSNKGAKVKVWGIEVDKADNLERGCAEDFANGLSKADVIVLPLPCTKDGKTIHTPLSDEEYTLADVCRYASDNAVIIGGKMDCSLFQGGSRIVCDYAAREDFASLNAVPTCEGAIEAAMKLMNVTIFSANCFVTGFGKCAKILALTLKAMGATVTVCARSLRDRSLAAAMGMDTVSIEDMHLKINVADAVFNTIPHRICSARVLSLLRPGVPFVDVASAPGGLDPRDAEKYGINYAFLPALPGKYAPVTAARIILKTLENIIGESGKDANLWIYGEKG